MWIIEYKCHLFSLRASVECSYDYGKIKMSKTTPDIDSIPAEQILTSINVCDIFYGCMLKNDI